MADVIFLSPFKLGDPREHIRRVWGGEVTDKCKTIWGLEEEGKVKGAWRDLGIPGLWYTMGSFVSWLGFLILTCNVLFIYETLPFAVSILALRRCFIHLQHNLREFRTISVLS